MAQDLPTGTIVQKYPPIGSSKAVCVGGGDNSPIPPTIPRRGRFYDLLEEIAEIHAAKAHDYGDEEGDNLHSAALFGIKPSVGVFLRLNDKVQRVAAITRAGRQKVTEETLIDTCKDIAVYALKAVELLEEEQGKTGEGTGTG